MSIDVRPDPRHPNGGHALIALDPPPAGEEMVVSVFDVFSQRYLGANGWQATQERFGPYPLERSGSGAAVRIGPEIVNQIEEYAALRLTVAGLAGGEVSGEVAWPDDIAPLPGAAVRGGIYVPKTESAPKPDNLVGRFEPAKETAPAKSATAGETASASVSKPAGTTAPIVDETPIPPVDPPEKTTGTDGGRKPLLLGGLALLVLLAGGAAWYFSQGEEPQPEPPAEVVAPAPAPEPEPVAPAATGCDAAAFAGLAGQGFAATLARFTECGSAVTPDLALGLVEEAAAGGDALALLQLGELYDNSAAGGVVKTVIGLKFDDTPPNAAEYYFRAREAGSPLAAERLQALCTRMRGASDTLSIAALGDYCAQ